MASVNSRNYPRLMRTFCYYWLPLLLYCTFIFIQSAFPSPESMPEIPHMDKVNHFIAYAIMGILFFRAYRTLRLRNNTILLIILSILSSTFYGLTDEFHQFFVPERHMDMMDLLADAVGSCIGVVGYYRVKAARMTK